MKLQTKTPEIDLDSIDRFVPTNTIIDLPVHLYLKNRKDHARDKDKAIITSQTKYRIFPLEIKKKFFRGAIGISSHHSTVELALWPRMPKGVDDSDYVNVFDPNVYMKIIASIENHSFEYGKGWKFEEKCTFEFGNFSGPTSIYSKILHCAHFAQDLIRQLEGVSYLFGFDKPEDAFIYRSYYEVDINPDGDYYSKE